MLYKRRIIASCLNILCLNLNAANGDACHIITYLEYHMCKLVLVEIKFNLPECHMMATR